MGFQERSAVLSRTRRRLDLPIDLATPQESSSAFAHGKDILSAESEVESFMHGHYWIVFIYSMHKYGSIALVIVLLAIIATTTAKPRCNPSEAKLSCLMGCVRCMKSYGRNIYNMASCCEVCQNSQAIMIDDGPTMCSKKFLFKGVIKGEDMNDIL